MAITHVTINQSASALASEVRNAVEHLKNADQKLRTLTEIMETYVDGTDYTALETVLGVQAGEGETVYNLIAGANTATDASDIHQVVIRLG